MTEHCRYCKQDIEPVFKERPDTIHAGQLNCPLCGRFLRWKAKDQNEKRQRSRKDTEKVGRDFCEMCLRHKTRLGAKEVLEWHHVIPIEQGGDNSANNAWILCTACHSLVDFVRVYLNKHMEGVFKDLEDLRGHAKDIMEYDAPFDV